MTATTGGIPSMSAEALAGTGGLVRLALRRDRVLIGIWLLVVVGVLAAAAATTESTYPTPQARQDRYAQILAVPMFMLFQSRAFADSPGALTAQQAFAGTTLAAALGAVLLVVRHTRGEEQAGRRELLGATVMGRHAPLAAVLAVVLGCGVAVAVAGTASVAAAGLPLAGALVLGGVTGAAVWVAAGMAAVAAQVAARAGVAVALGFGTFGALHYMRGIAHLGGADLAWLGWLTPNGWLEQARPFAGDRWWPLLLAVTATAVLIGAAMALSSRRDVGAALLPPRQGPAAAPPALRDPVRLAWRLHRPGLLAWAAGMAVVGLAMGRVGSAAMSEYGDIAWVRDYAAAMRIADPADAFFAYVVFAFVLASAAQAVHTALRLRGEEAAGLADAVLGTAQTRYRWMAGHLAVAMGAPVLLQACLGLGLGIGATTGAAGAGLAGELGRAFALTVPVVPAVWVVVGVTAAVFGFSARWAPVAGWVAVTLGVAGELAVKAGLPEIVYLATSPFAHVSPYYQPTPATYLALTALACALVAAGAVLLRRRDIVRT